MSKKEKIETSENEEFSFTKQQQFNFDDFEDDLDDTFLIEYKNIRKRKESAVKNYQETKEDKQLSKQLKKEMNDMKNNNKSKSRISIIFFIIILLLVGFIVCHFITFNHNKVKVVTKEKIVEVVDDNYLFLGDSITSMFELEKYFLDQPVINSGVSGNFTYEILDDMNNRIYKYNPSKVFILIGTNDIYKNESIDEIVGNVEKIIKGINKNRPLCEIYLESIYPINRTEEEKIDLDMVKNRTNGYIKEINNEYKKLAIEYDITYIDVYDKLIDETGNLKLEYTKEGLHLIDKGYEVVAQELKKYMED